MRLIPPVDVLQQRLQSVEARISQCDKDLRAASGVEHQRLLVTRRALQRRAQWYVQRIRVHKPVQPLGVAVHEDIHAGEALA